MEAENGISRAHGPGASHTGGSDVQEETTLGDLSTWAQIEAARIVERACARWWADFSTAVPRRGLRGRDQVIGAAGFRAGFDLARALLLREPSQPD